MKRRIFFILIAVVLIAVPIAISVHINDQVRADASISIDMVMEDSFTLGDTILFDYSVTSDIAVDISLSCSIYCPIAPVPTIYQAEVYLDAGVPYTGTYGSMVVDESFDPQSCTARVTAVNKETNTVYIEERDFAIDVNPGIDIQISTCRDPACTEESKVFVKDETIHIGYYSSVPEIEVFGKLTTPDNTEQQISLPISIIVNQIGTYYLEITAFREGYRTLNTRITFGVIEEEAQIPLVEVCNANRICELGESYQNCPQDCSGEDTDSDGVLDYEDNCRYCPNSDQLDSNQNCPISPYTNDPACGDYCEYAIWADSTTVDRPIDWSGGKTSVNGKVHSNSDIYVGGSQNKVYDTMYYVDELVNTGDHNSFASLQQILPRPMPIRFNMLDYKPGGSLAIKAEGEAKYHYIDGDFRVSKSKEKLDGLYYVKGNANLSGSNIRGTFTIVAEGTIAISASGMNCSAYSNGLLFFSDGASLIMSGSSSTLGGIIYVPTGQIAISGSGNKINGRLFGNTVVLSGSNTIITVK